MIGKGNFLILMAAMLFICQCIESETLYQESPVDALSNKFASEAKNFKFNMKTQEGFNMDCLKAIKNKNQEVIGVFHSSLEQQKSGYNAVYYAKQLNNNWNKVTRVSERGSQGYIYEIPDSTAYLVLYELQNHEKGNTIAIRYYQNTQKLEINNFLYEYQINQFIDKKKVVNIGTPSVEQIMVTKKEVDQKFNEFKLNIKFHYCPDGSHDYPGYGSVNMIPLRDFVDAQKHWIGGCKQNYSDWSGLADTKVEAAIRKIGISGKIGQRDVFLVNESGSINKYYFYEANLNSKFDWKNWRIILYSQKEDKAVMIPFQFNKVVDLANPHISLLSNPSENQYQFLMTFFLPGEGITPGTGAEGGQFFATAVIKI